MNDLKTDWWANELTRNDKSINKTVKALKNRKDRDQRQKQTYDLNTAYLKDE